VKCRVKNRELLEFPHNFYRTELPAHCAFLFTVSQFPGTCRIHGAPDLSFAVAYLAPIVGVDPVAFGTILLGKGMNLEGTTMEELLMRDTKRYELFKKKIIITPQISHP